MAVGRDQQHRQQETLTISKRRRLLDGRRRSRRRLRRRAQRRAPHRPNPTPARYSASASMRNTVRRAISWVYLVTPRGGPHRGVVRTHPSMADSASNPYPTAGADWRRRCPVAPDRACSCTDATDGRHLAGRWPRDPGSRGRAGSCLVWSCWSRRGSVVEPAAPPVRTTLRPGRTTLQSTVLETAGWLTSIAAVISAIEQLASHDVTSRVTTGRMGSVVPLVMIDGRSACLRQASLDPLAALSTPLLPCRPDRKIHCGRTRSVSTGRPAHRRRRSRPVRRHGCRLNGSPAGASSPARTEDPASPAPPSPSCASLTGTVAQTTDVTPSASVFVNLRSPGHNFF